MRTAIIDANYIFREGLKTIFSNEACIEFVGEGSRLNEGIELILEKKPEVVVLDMNLRNDNGLKLIEEIKRNRVDCKFVVLTNSSDYRDFRKAQEAGVEGYLLKDALPDEITYAIRTVYAGRKFYDANLMVSAMNLEKNDPFSDKSIQTLTQREKEVLLYLGKGYSNNEIGCKLFITEYTVKKHVSQILYKLGLTDRTQAAIYANTHGLVS